MAVYDAEGLKRSASLKVRPAVRANVEFIERARATVGQGSGKPESQSHTRSDCSRSRHGSVLVTWAAVSNGDKAPSDDAFCYAVALATAGGTVAL